MPGPPRHHSHRCFARQDHRRLTVEPFNEFLLKRQLVAVGMPCTTYGDDHEVVLHSARTYTPYVLVDAKPKRTNTLYKTYIEFPAMLRTCGGLNSTAEEIARLFGPESVWARAHKTNLGSCSGVAF